MKAVALIPARGGSKRLPRKNVAALGDRPLVRWSIDAAVGASIFDSIYVSSDDNEVLDIARRSGVRPLPRNVPLASDEATIAHVTLSAIDELESAGERFDAVYVLVPTSPFRTAASIRSAWQSFVTSACGGLVSVMPAVPPPEWTLSVSDGRLVARDPAGYTTPRTRLVPAFRGDGGHLIARVAYLRANGDFLGPDTVAFEAPSSERVDIDTAEDLAFAKFLLEREKTRESPRPDDN